MSQEQVPADGPRRPRRSFVRRHLALTSLLAIVVVIVVIVGGYLWWLNHQLSNIQRFDAGIHPAHAAPKAKAGKSDPQPVSDTPLNILLLGADNGGKNQQSVGQDLKDGVWTPGIHRSDTIMLVHVTANRKSVQIVSIPRDTWVKVPGYPYDGGYAKINAAFSYGGPKLSVKVVQHLTGIHIDHVAIIDWSGFKDLTNALGGITVYVPHTFYDDSQKITWHKGWQTLDGYRALQYVRTRHGLANGDFGRIMRQQNFMRAVMDKLLSEGTMSNPIKITRVVGVMVKYLILDDTWTNSEIRDLALSMRHLHSSDVEFTTAPLGSYATIDGQDVVQLNALKCKRLWRDLADGHLGRYLRQNPGSALASQTHVN